MSAYNGRFEPATFAGKPMLGVIGATIGGLAALVAFLFHAYPFASLPLALVALFGFGVAVFAFWLGDEMMFFHVMLRARWRRSLKTIEHRPR